MTDRREPRRPVRPHGTIDVVKTRIWCPFILTGLRRFVWEKASDLRRLSKQPHSQPSERPLRFAKYHGLGNDYLVLPPIKPPCGLSADAIRIICHRNYGVGSDGILYGPLDSVTSDFGLQIFNPDGSEAEKSGNGLRIFARFLWDEGLVSNSPFSVETLGGDVVCHVSSEGDSVTVAMGKVSFESDRLAVPHSDHPSRDSLTEELHIHSRRFTFCSANVGNPHCVVLSEDPSEAEAREYGPVLEVHPRFPNRTNVQFMEVLDRGALKIEIWERGAGYTLASGSSSTAAAAVAHRLGFCDAKVDVKMPGGTLRIELDEDFRATMSGPVVKICDGVLDDRLLVQ